MSKPSPKDHPFQNDPKELGTCKVCKCLEGTHGDGKVTSHTNLSDEELRDIATQIADKVFNMRTANHYPRKCVWRREIMSALKQVRRETREECALTAQNISSITGYPHYQHTADAVATAILALEGR